jgi:hypothetical protein
MSISRIEGSKIVEELKLALARHHSMLRGFSQHVLPSRLKGAGSPSTEQFTGEAAERGKETHSDTPVPVGPRFVESPQLRN